MYQNPFTFSVFSFYLYIILLSIIFVSACGWDSEIVAPENFEDSYAKLHDCRPSAHPAAAYIITWLSPNGLETWDALKAGETDVDFTKDVVVVKSQYANDKCTQLTGYTIMGKISGAEDVGNWKWQFVDQHGRCNDCDQGASCAGCHTTHESCPQAGEGPTHFCTVPE